MTGNHEGEANDGVRDRADESRDRPMSFECCALSLKAALAHPFARVSILRACASRQEGNGGHSTGA